MYNKIDKFEDMNIECKMTRGKTTIATITSGFFTIKVIPVAFPFHNVMNVPSFQDFFAVYVLAHFDLPICKVAINFKLEINFGSSLTVRCIDTSFIDTPGNWDPSRVLKYEERKMTERVIQPGKMSLQLLFLWLKRVINPVVL